MRLSSYYFRMLIESFLYRVGDVLSCPQTGSNPEWCYDYALVVGIEYRQFGLGWGYRLESCDRNGNISPVSLSSWMGRKHVGDGWGKLVRPGC